MSSGEDGGLGLPPFEGVIPVLVTPFESGDEIDLEAFDAEVEFLASTGVRWVGIGFGSEVQRLTTREVDEIVHRAAENAAVEVIGNADVTSIGGARERIRQLADNGARAILLRPPSLPGLDVDAIEDAYRAVAAGSPISLIVQDAAAMTGTDLPVPVMASLLETVPEIAAVKIESADPTVKIRALDRRIGAGEHRILAGSGGAGFAWELCAGAHGTMPGPAFPELFLALFKAHCRGEQDTARRLQARLLPYLAIGDRSMDVFVYSQKFALVRRGVLRDPRLRRPHPVMDLDVLERELTALLDDLDEDRGPDLEEKGPAW